MGRAKLKMELISKDKTRSMTYRKRKDGLMKKVYEFSTLCDVSTCVIIYGPDQGQAEVWPPDNPAEVKRILDVYKDKRDTDGVRRNFNLSDFFEDRKKKVQDELDKTKKKNMEAKFPTWFDALDSCTESQLRQFADSLDKKLVEAKARMQMLQQPSHMESNNVNYPSFNSLSYDPTAMLMPLACVDNFGITTTTYGGCSSSGGGCPDSYDYNNYGYNDNRPLQFFPMTSPLTKHNISDHESPMFEMLGAPNNLDVFHASYYAPELPLMQPLMTVNVNHNPLMTTVNVNHQPLMQMNASHHTLMSMNVNHRQLMPVNVDHHPGLMLRDANHQPSSRAANDDDKDDEFGEDPHQMT